MRLNPDPNKLIPSRIEEVSSGPFPGSAIQREDSQVRKALLRGAKDDAEELVEHGVVQPLYSRGVAGGEGEGSEGRWESIEKLFGGEVADCERRERRRAERAEEECGVGALSTVLNARGITSTFVVEW